MSTEEEFEVAVARINELSKAPSPQVMLSLYAFYKQATQGDVQGKRPGILDTRARAKFDAWQKLKGMSPEEARQGYLDVVNSL